MMLPYFKNIKSAITIISQLLLRLMDLISKQQLLLLSYEHIKFIQQMLFKNDVKSEIY